ncbi:hypothetical protein ACRE_066470 [Hapsidospora chrysogenum ATCC 11550]|uniref:Sugar phosphate phosphatase n=1 Tax=Hapsidospora chrysogenum (strain ATCC 11550 / CBS 779.69 / DSM 880 / IAM 14645 / JCM 23072 / IMI 49137) TaxID=857340 RepID=A0A086SZV5_HAPC1|nr:hypothetical protein ACRE_066470 [Hapsidospora chrysogenum ATCC 11550]
MEYDTKTPQSMTSDPTSFASDSVRNRWPTILTGAIDDVHRAVSKTEDPEAQAEGKKIIEQLANLKYEVQHDHKLTPIPNDEFPEEVAAYNKEIEQRGNPSWLDVPWLFSECYMYRLTWNRRISTFFSLSKHWKTYDIFARQKMDTFRTSRKAVLELSKRYKELIEELKANKNVTHDVEAEKVLFSEMFEICLWGNATDLSLLTNLTYEDIQKLQGAEARKAAEKNILINDLPKTYELLKKARDEGKAERRVDIVLDNAGFELYVDLVLAGFLLASGLATQIVLRPKSIPWFVSDVLPGDFSALLNAISNPRAFFETQSEEEKLQGKTPVALTKEEDEELQFVFQHWAELHAEGQLVMRPNRYWTAGGSFWRLPKEAPELYEDLKPAELVIFKGDLNYRKLTGDAHWDPTTPFTTALGPMGPGSGVNVLSLRTCKADVVVGLKPGQDEELKKIGGDVETGARKWAWHGKWAVVCLSNGS